MPDREWFLRAIEAEPGDDGIRLAFSDWLEENGDDARARFIRLQCEHHRLHGGGRTFARPPQRSDPGRQIDALLKRHREAWTAGLPEWAAGAEFERGFPHVFQMTAKQFLEGGAALRAVAPLDTLALRRLKGREAAVFASEHLAGVSRLWAEGAQLTDAGVVALVNSPYLGRVRWLALGRSTLWDADEPNRLTDASAVALAGAENLPALVHLELDDYRKISAAGLRALVESGPRAGLKKLNIAGQLTGPVVRKLFRGPAFRLTGLEELNLNRRKLGDAGAEELAAAPALRNLRLLWLSQNTIGDRGAAALASSHFSGLIDLDLWRNQLTDAGVRPLLALRGLRRLELGENARITDASARAVLDDPRPWEKVGLNDTAVSGDLLARVAERCARPT